MVLKTAIKQKIEVKIFPQQMLLAKLLSFSEKEMDRVITEELEKNPFLDIDNDVNKKDFEKYFATEGVIMKYKKKSLWEGGDFEPISQENFLEKIFAQIDNLDLSFVEKDIARYVVNNLDEKGFLLVDIDFVINYFFSMRQINVSPDTVRFVLKKVQKIIPIGLATKNTREFFLLQLEKNNDDVSTFSKKIIENNFADFSRGNWVKIAKFYKVSTDKINDVVACLKKLKPYPTYGLNSSESTVATVNPDFFVFKNKNGDFEVKLKAYFSLPLRVNNLYKEQMKKEATNEDFLSFAKEKIVSAKNFIAAIEKRREVLLKTVRSIVDFQKEYFSCGDISFLRPMTLKDVSALADIDISTVSRIANSKYIETIWGIVGIKELFSGFFLKKDGGEVNAKFVMNKIREIILRENKKKPLSDKKIVNILTKEGIVISRRTVTKYREKIGIAESRIRKNLNAR